MEVLVNSDMMLIVARGIQGLGGALLSPATLSLIMSNFEEGKETKPCDVSMGSHGWSRFVPWVIAWRVLTQLFWMGSHFS